MSLQDIKSYKKNVQYNFKRIKYYSSIHFHLKIYFLLLLFHIVSYLCFAFIFSFVFLDQKGCSIQIFGACKKIFY
jgi:hypothetical protein